MANKRISAIPLKLNCLIERTNNYFTILLDIGVNFYYLIDVLKGALKMTVNKISELNGRRSDALLSFDSLLFEV